MKYRIIISLFLVASCLFNGCTSPEDPKLTHEYIYYVDGKEEQVKTPTIGAKIKNGVDVPILPTEWMGFYHDLDNYVNIRNYFVSGIESTKPVATTLSWENKEECDNYGVELSTHKDMSESTYFSTSNNKTLELKDLYAGTHYYYQIHAQYEDRKVVSKRFDFSTTDFFRTLDIDRVLNARDFGNKKTDDKKKRVKQGMVYRSANLDSVTTTGRRDAIEKYGIKTDLDLREAGPKASPLGDTVKYINNATELYGSPQYYSLINGVNCVEYQTAMLNNLKVFADKDNFPLVFHCAIGRDRTGTLAITLYLLLGINIEQIQQDYIASFFSSACNKDSFENCCEQMEALIYYYSYYKGKDGISEGTVYERTEEYARDIGLSIEEIKAIRDNLLEDNR